MGAIDHLASLTLTAERASSEGAVTIDLYERNEAAGAGGKLEALWDAPAPIGRIVAERGRICWIRSKGSESTLSDLLAAETGIPREQLEQVYQAARHEGSPFCETLAETGLVSAADVRRVLRRQAGSGLAALARIQSENAVAVSVARIPRLSYEKRFTFGALEMLQQAIVGSQELRREVGELPATFAGAAKKLAGALCFRESAASELALVPISCISKRELSLAGALELSVTGLAAAQPTDPVGAAIQPFALLPDDDGYWLCAWRKPHLTLFLVRTREEYLSLLEGLLTESH